AARGNSVRAAPLLRSQGARAPQTFPSLAVKNRLDRRRRLLHQPRALIGPPTARTRLPPSLTFATHDNFPPACLILARRSTAFGNGFSSLPGNKLFPQPTSESPIRACRVGRQGE